MIVQYLFSLNPLINPRGACFFEYPTSRSRTLILKNRTVRESEGLLSLEWTGVVAQRNVALLLTLLPM